MSDIHSALKKVVLTDILAQPTEEKEVNFIDVQPQFNENDFSAGFNDQPTNEFSEHHEPLPNEEEPIDPQVEATKLVNLISAGNNLLTVPLANWKMTKSRGGKKEIERMKVAYLKSRRGEKLSEAEQNLATMYQAYEADKAILLESLPYTDQQMQTLIEVAIPYCEANQIKINGAFAFYGVLAGIQMDKVIKILTV